jgi:DNA-directed RNA polymerase subunit beta'
MRLAGGNWRVDHRHKRNELEARELRSLRVSLASPEQIRSWSYGEVTKPETINYRRLRPEKDGLFCEAIFGPTKDWRCYCGKYKNVRHRGIVCDKCGVEVTRSAVRRERMGHIELAAPVAHLWYTRRVPSYLAYLLDISKRDLDRVLYFAQYVITYVDEDARNKALKRLDAELDEQREKMELVAQEGIAALEQRLSEEEARVRGQMDATRAEIEERLAAATEPVIKDARALQKKVDERQGKTIRVPLIFRPTGTIIADKGVTVGREHLALLNKVVQEHLDEIERNVITEQAERQQPLQAEIKHWREATAEEIKRLKKQLSADVAELQARSRADREELIALAQLQFLSEPRLRDLKSRWGQVFKAGMGAEAFLEILRTLNLDKLSDEMWREVRHGTSKQRRRRAVKRLRVVQALRRSGNQPEWMIMTVLPVIPPDLRPMVQLDGGRFATSDLNDLYRRVINRNNRLRRLLELGAPAVIVSNEKRMLQEAVDSLIDNSKRGKARSRRGRRELKSLSDMLKGKKGRFRRNLLGKRVDYSGRSVIVVGPRLKMYQCGLPKTMALELYRPFVISKLVEYNYAGNVKAAKRIIERQRPEVWEVLEEVSKVRPVLLNRAPTLHRLGIQAFEPVLVEGKAVRIHPLVCAAFNADFDGDQMAVHVPLSRQAVEESRKLMLSTCNLLKPANGQPIVGPTKDMCLGVYYLTMEDPAQADEKPRPFVDLDEVEIAHTLGKIDLHAPIIVAHAYGHPDRRRKPVITTVGRCLFNRILPEDLRFVNKPLDKGTLQDLIGECYQKMGAEVTTQIADSIKDIGFKYATHSGVTIAISDLTIPDEKTSIIEETERSVAEINRQYRRGLLTEEEQYTRVVELWSQTQQQVSRVVSAGLDPTGTVAVMAKSGASKGGFNPIAQLAGMRGLMSDPSGRIIEQPIRSSFREGLSAQEYFISTHGSRKGLADTAMRTADAGYLTRRLVDVVQDLVINAHDCGTTAGVWVRSTDDIGGQSMSERLVGRTAAGRVAHPKTGEVLIDRNEEIDEEAASAIEGAGVGAIRVRSPMTCQLHQGICALCYGRDLGRGGLVAVGAAVGIVAAQSIGEPGTQLTLRTFHTGGVAHAGDITAGLPRVVEVFEARKKPKGEAPMSEIGGVVHILRSGDERHVLVVDGGLERFKHEIKRGWKILVGDGDEIKAGDPLARWRDEKEILAEKSGRVSVKGRKVTLIHERRVEKEYEVPATGRLLVQEGQKIEPGVQLVEGVLNPHQVLHIRGRESTQQHLLSEIQSVYRSQGVNINDKHLEVVFRKMLGKVQVAKCGDTDLLPGELVDRLALEDVNREVVEAGGQPASAWPVLLGITKAALNTESFLSAASFQHTIKILSAAAVEGKEDPLLGLKENVILGRLIPAGTGYRGDGSDSGGLIERYEDIPLQAPAVDEVDDTSTALDSQSEPGEE